MATAFHGALMVWACFGTLIALERAVALKHPATWCVPLLAGLGAPLLLAAGPAAAAWAWGLAGCGFVAMYLGVGSRHGVSPHLAVEAAGACCWPLGVWAWAWHGDAGAVSQAGMAFLVLTIAGERRELAQFVRLPAAARLGFLLAAGLAFAATVWRCVLPARGAPAGLLWWMGSAALALWLLRFDLVLRAWRDGGWRGHTARCLGLGCLWLLAASVLSLAAPGSPAATAAPHLVLLGFVFSMVFGHAPIVLPALARRQPRHTPRATWPLWIMGASLVVRLAGQQLGEPRWLQAAGVAHAAAILLFAVVMAAAMPPRPPSLRPR
ncbi:hypothetical protein [Eleftheria terrae]|uniref:hypothetical protein n=1 Tax=Eleftheria terrae TaxID=1597781 RepID=UPI00263A9108|nr:hypothetical protein [Eleftheria terrae]WKB55392.1 hypothetical protein N7L95_25250 [Eleftheria terrae]